MKKSIDHSVKLNLPLDGLVLGLRCVSETFDRHCTLSVVASSVRRIKCGGEMGIFLLKQLLSPFQSSRLALQPPMRDPIAKSLNRATGNGRFCRPFSIVHGHQIDAPPHTSLNRISMQLITPSIASDRLLNVWRPDSRSSGELLQAQYSKFTIFFFSAPFIKRMSR